MAAAAIGALAWWWLAGRTFSGRPGANVLLVTIDTLRADAVGAYGRIGAATPWMDRLAAAGVRFDAAYAHNVVTLPSHANILSGRPPTDHGVRDNAGFVFPRDQETLATRLKARGYRTGAFVSAFPLAARFGLNRGFDVYDDRFVDAAPGSSFQFQERRGAETVDAARRWIDADPSRPYFCWVHLYEPHFPYEPPPPLAAQFAAAPYHGEVAAADAALGPLLRPILASGRDGNTLVVLTADHGESLGEHGEATHGVFAYEPVLRVPLLLYQPRIWSPRAVSDAASHVDLVPTVLEALSLPVPTDLPGRSLMAAAGGRTAAAAPIYFESLSASLNRGWAPLRGVLDGGLKFIDLPIPELYDVRGDPAERTNLVSSRAASAARLRDLLGELRQSERAADRTEIDRETRERLRSLGYIASSAPTTPASYTEDDDPKRLIALDAVLQEVEALVLAGRLDEARTRCEALIRKRPGMALSYLHLAQIERDSGNSAAAVRALEKAIGLTPGDSATAALLGAALVEAGRAADVVRLLEPYARRDPPDVQALVTLGLALGRTGRFDEAAAAIDAARAREPSNAMLLVHAGTIQLMAGDRSAARRSFEASLALNPGVSRAHSSLAFLDAEDGRVDASLERWKAAVALDRREFGNLLGLATLLNHRAGPAGARPYLEFFVTAAPPDAYGDRIRQVRAWLSAAG